jgi:hypothetical protein
LLSLPNYADNGNVASQSRQMHSCPPIPSCLVPLYLPLPPSPSPKHPPSTQNSHSPHVLFVPPSAPSPILALALARARPFRFVKSQLPRTLTRPAAPSDPSPVPHPVLRRPSPSTWTRRSSCRTRVVATARSASTSPSSSRPRYGPSILHHSQKNSASIHLSAQRGCLVQELERGRKPKLQTPNTIISGPC